MKTHRPMVGIALSFGLGILLSRFVRLRLFFPWVLSVLFLICVLRFCQRPKVSSVFLLLTFLCLGYIHVQYRATLEKDHIVHIAKYYRRKPMELRGVVISDVQRRSFFNKEKTTFTLEVRQVKAPWGWRNRSGKILVNVYRHADVAYGHYVQLEGKLHRPYNFSAERKFSYEEYLKHRGIRRLLSVKKNGPCVVLATDQGNPFRALSLKARNKLKEILTAHLSVNEAGVMQAILLGDRSHIPHYVRELFVQTGTAHILAISGLHVGIVAGLFLILLRILPIDRRLQLLLAILFLLGYAFLTGGRPSVIRATIMAVVFLASFIIERESDVLNTLCLAAWVILLFNPLNFFDIGFQLTFVCVLSIVLISPKLKQVFARLGLVHGSKTMNCLGDAISVSLGVWLGVAGLIVYYFGIVTPITVLANLLVVPFISVIVTIGFALLISGVMVPSVAFMFSVCLKLCLNLMVGIIFLLEKIPYSHFYVSDVILWHVIGYYFLVVAVIGWPWQSCSQYFKKRLLRI